MQLYSTVNCSTTAACVKCIATAREWMVAVCVQARGRCAPGLKTLEDWLLSTSFS